MPKLDHIANAFIIGTCLFIAGTLAYRSRTLSPPPYRAGDTLTDKGKLGLAGAPRTLVVVTNSYCHFCSESMPFYQKLSQLSRRSGARFVAATAEDPERNRAYLGANGVFADAVVSVWDSKLNIHATPTIIVVNSNGTVVGCWVGKLPEQAEAEVERVLTSG
jgi:thiol-disulfide isomerase/thioredoxin